MAVKEDAKRYKDSLIFPAALDPDALKIIRRLKQHGHEAYLVGGCVRDLLLGSIPKDFDVATSARPRQIRRLFKNSKVIGRRFKLAHVTFRDKVIEVSTFRKSPDLNNDFFKSDGLLIIRDNVYGDRKDDALRRDFTVNALFYDVDNEEVVDYVGGVPDIENRVLRTIGDPDIRFQEDPVRILRALRFSCRLNLEIHPASFEAMKRYLGEITRSASQRVTEEIIRLVACGASRKALEMMMELGLFEILLPEAHAALDREMGYFDIIGPGKGFLLDLAAVMDRIDKGRRGFENPMYLSLLFGPLGGSAIHDARKDLSRPVDPGAVLNQALRPTAIRMGISRRDLSRIKQILIAFQKLSIPRKRRRSRPRDLVCREYFPYALEYYRLVTEAKGEGLDRYHWWGEQRSQFLKEDRKPRPPRKRRRSRGSGRSRKKGRRPGSRGGQPPPKTSSRPS